MKRIVSSLLMLISTMFLCSQALAATSVDALIEKLVDKGVLSREEGLELKAEIAQDEKLVREDGLKTGLPEWINKTKLKGDLRLRYQDDKRKGSATRNRGRLRYRLGLENQITDQIKVGAGLASGNADPRSTNVSFENSFDKPDIRLDLAYAEYGPTDWLKLTGGKFVSKDYLWLPTDMLWDSDINPEGGSMHMETSLNRLFWNTWDHQILNETKVFLNGGSWVIDEASGNKNDPYLVYGQPGVAYKGSKFDATLAGVYYGFNNLKGVLLDNASCTNTGIALVGSNCSSGSLSFDYLSRGGSAEVGVKNLFGGLPFDLDNRIAFFGEFITNDDPRDNNNGWAYGMKFGSEKVNGKNQWQIKTTYVNLQKDAFPDAFPDSDRYNPGSTDVESYEVALEYGLFKNVILGFDWYHSQRMKAAENPENLLQTDISFKF